MLLSRGADPDFGMRPDPYPDPVFKVWLNPDPVLNIVGYGSGLNIKV